MDLRVSPISNGSASWLRPNAATAGTPIIMPRLLNKGTLRLFTIPVEHFFLHPLRLPATGVPFASYHVYRGGGVGTFLRGARCSHYHRTDCQAFQVLTMEGCSGGPSNDVTFLLLLQVPSTTHRCRIVRHPFWTWRPCFFPPRVTPSNLFGSIQSPSCPLRYTGPPVPCSVSSESQPILRFR